MDKLKLDLGREIFLSQLDLLQQLGYALETRELIFDSEVDAYTEKGKRYGLQLSKDGLYRAFIAYHNEYIDTSGSAVNEDGPFCDFKDIRGAVLEKLYYFFKPFALRLDSAYPDLDFRVVIQPSYADGSNILIRVENAFGKPGPLPFPFEVYQVWWKAYGDFFSDQEPETVLTELAEWYQEMLTRVEAIMPMVRWATWNELTEEIENYLADEDIDPLPPAELKALVQAVWAEFLSDYSDYNNKLQELVEKHRPDFFKDDD